MYTYICSGGGGAHCLPGEARCRGHVAREEAGLGYPQEVSLLPDISVKMVNTTDISGNGGGGAVLLEWSADSLVDVSIVQFEDARRCDILDISST